MFAGWKISRKLLFGFSAVLILLTAISCFNIFSSIEIKEKVAFVKSIRYRNSIEAIKFINTAEKVLANLRYAAASANFEILGKAIRIKEEYDRNLTEIRESLEADPQTASILGSFDESLQQCFTIGSRMARYSIDQEFVEYVSAQNQFNSLFEGFTRNADDLRENVSSALHGTLEEINQLSRDAIRLSIFLSLFAIILGMVLAGIISRHISHPMARLVELLSEMGKGNLSVRYNIRRRDEIGQVATALNEMAERLSDMVHGIDCSSEELTRISENISSVSLQVDEGAEVQARGVEETSSAVAEISASVQEVGQGVDHLTASASESTSSVLEVAASIEEVSLNMENLFRSVEDVGSSMAQMAGTIRQVADSAHTLREYSSTTAASVIQMDAAIEQVEGIARETAGIAEKARRDAEKGQSSVEATRSGIDQIRSASQITTASIEMLSEKVRDIGSILSVIDEVADQTNLLALNAAIIAAQAGEHGRGFAVVADEIRELADRTSSSTREIAGMIHGVQQETSRAVDAIARADQSIAEGERLSRDSGEALHQIVTGVQDATRRMEHIARATAEQTQGSRVIRQSVEKISEMIDQIAAATREQTRGSELIMAATQRIKDLTAQANCSVREQSAAGKVIARSMENISEMIQKIRGACHEQTKGSSQIVHAIEDIRTSAGNNLHSSRALNEAVLNLSGQIDGLRREMRTFRVSEKPCGSSLPIG